MRKGRQEEAEMETLLMEIPCTSPSLLQCRWEEPWRVEVEPQRRRQLDESSLVSAPPMEGEGAYRYGIPGYGDLDAWNALGEEQQEELGLRGQVSSIGIGKEKSVAVAAAIGNKPIDPYGIWSRQETPMSSPGSICSLPINLLSDGGVWSDLQHNHNQDSGLGRNPYERTMQVADGTDVLQELPTLQQKRCDSDEYWDVASPPISPQTVLPNSPSGLSILAQQKGLSVNGYNPQYLTAAGTPKGIDTFGWEDNFIIQGEELRCTASNNLCGVQRERKWLTMGGRLYSRVAPLVTVDHLRIPWRNCLPSVPPKYESLMDVRGFVCFVAKDQQGCRFLQHKFDGGTEQEREMIFNEIIGHFSDLMVNPFGNYLMQKILDMCTEEQRLEIILVLAEVPDELVRISLNMHGTRAVQKLIEVLQGKTEIALVISALQPGFLNLVMDPNGNHVIQHCLQCLSYEQNKFIYDAAARHCVDIATHRYGCCVLQRCIAHSTGQRQARLLTEVSQNGLILAQDAYGNYAVQYVLNMKNPSVIEELKSIFKGNFVQLSMQKFSSNVVEKCLCVFDEVGRRLIISELLSVNYFDHLMQDPYANYVIQSALLVCKGHARTSLVDAIRPHAILRANPYCKGIFNLLKK